MRAVCAVIGVILLLGGCSFQSPTVAPTTIRVSAASSLTDALEEARTVYQKAHAGTNIELNCGASGQLQAQIEHGAPSDVFVSASPKEMNALSTKGMIVESSRVTLVGNELVLIAPQAKALKSWNDLSTDAVKKIALANPESVPAGRYAKETLEHRNLWSAVNPKAVFGENVRQVLKYVQSGDVDAGIVFRSDVDPKDASVRIVDKAQNGIDHKTIDYPIAVLKSAHDQASALAFAQFLSSNEGRPILIRHGFSQPR